MPTSREARLGLRAASYLIPQGFICDTKFLKECIKPKHVPDDLTVQRAQDNLMIELSIAAFRMKAILGDNVESFGAVTVTTRKRQIAPLRNAAKRYAKHCKNPAQFEKAHEKLQYLLRKILHDTVFRLAFREAVHRTITELPYDTLDGLHLWNEEFEQASSHVWWACMAPSWALRLCDVCDVVEAGLKPAKSTHYFDRLIVAAADYWMAMTGRKRTSVRIDPGKQLTSNPDSEDGMYRYVLHPNEQQNDDAIGYSHLFEYICTLLAQLDDSISGHEVRSLCWPSYHQVVAIQKRKIV